MTHEQFLDALRKQRKDLIDYQRRRWAVSVGRIAKDHYQDNFRKSGFVNNGLKKWEPAKRITSGRTGAASKYKTLLSSRNHLFSGIQYIPGNARVVISNPVPYAAAHQFGETIEVSITPKMRRFAWRKYYEIGEGKVIDNEEKANTEASLWKGLALTKKTKLSIKLPARPFIGESAELTEKIKVKTDETLRAILSL